MKSGDWVWHPNHPRGILLFGVVRDVYEIAPGDTRLNLYVYDCDGLQIGRHSEPDLGEPRGYEPNLCQGDFILIEEPEFPFPYLDHVQFLKVIS